MKVKVFSDLHLEFSDGYFDVGTGDVLVLAGDICPASSLMKEDSYKEFFATCVANYNKVFYVMGNHEHYDHDFYFTENDIRNNLPTGITLLENEVEFYNGWAFVGTSLWASFNNYNIEEMHACGDQMNDYNLVTNGHRILTPIDTAIKHKEAMNYLESVIPTLSCNVFVITHHAPSFESISNEYRSADVQGAYASDLTSFIEANPNIKFWTHGHVHETNNYMVGETNVISNPRGYHQYGENGSFDSNVEIELV